MTQVTLSVSTDTSAIGTDATEADLDAFAQNLADTIADRFSVSVHLVRGSYERSTDCDDPEVRAWLHQISQSDEWLHYL